MKLREDGGVCPAVVSRKEQFSFVLSDTLMSTHSKLYRETVKMCLFSVSNYFCLIFYFFFFWHLETERISFCYLSTQLYKTDQMLIFTVPGVELGVGCFSFKGEKTYSEN